MDEGHFNTPALVPGQRYKATQGDPFVKDEIYTCVEISKTDKNGSPCRAHTVHGVYFVVHGPTRSREQPCVDAKKQLIWAAGWTRYLTPIECSQKCIHDPIEVSSCGSKKKFCRLCDEEIK
jgi:hypothetical protein